VHGRKTRNPSVTSRKLQDKKADGSKFSENGLTYWSTQVQKNDSHPKTNVFFVDEFDHSS